jgi:plasmid stabilization system protein ParE
VTTYNYDIPISITEQAEADLRGIYEYIAFEKLSPKNAVILHQSGAKS